MFRGIVLQQGEVRRARRRSGIVELEVEAPSLAKELHEGDSVAVNGVCLTAIESSRRRFTAEVTPETLAVSTLGSLAKGQRVNLELPARVSDRIGGHIVQGHADGIAEVTRSQEEDAARRVWLSLAPELLRYLVKKGSVTLDGVSLTVAEVGRTTFQVALIPHTLSATTLGSLRVGQRLNVEVDVIAKYVEALMERS